MLQSWARSNRNRLVIGLVVAAMLAAPGTARAAILSIDASVATSVQERIDGAPGSVNTDNETLTPTSELPISATAQLTSTDLGGVLVGTAQGFSEFSDPTRLPQPNPEEFALEVGCYSNTASLSYSVEGTATESRDVIFTTPGNPLADPEIVFDNDGTRRIESRIFLSGAVVVWSTTPGQALDALLAELEVTVTQDDAGTPVFRTRLRVQGDGTDGITTERVGPVLFEEITLADLEDQGLDEESLAILEQVQQAGALVILAIPEQEHTYDYEVVADETTVLTALLSGKLENGPSGTGIAATWGRPFENLADFIGQGLPGVDGDELERAINAETAARRIGPVPRTGDGLGGGLCGAMGMESMMGAGLLLGMMFARSRRG